MRRFQRLLPAEPRCKFCNAPFRGVGGMLMRIVFRKEPSVLNPRYCNMCEQASREFPGGAEVPMSMLFADVRGSTALSESMSPTAFSQLISRFYRETTRLIIDADGLVEKLAGDSVAAFWGAGFAGPQYVQRTVEVAQRLAREMKAAEIPVGVGVHAGTAFFGAMTTPEGLSELTAVGDEVNTAARLASKAAAGEVIVSEDAMQAAGLDTRGLEQRRLELKGIREPVVVRVLED